MHITVEISYYPLLERYEVPVKELLALLENHPEVEAEVGGMSTLLGGEYNDVMNLLTTSMRQLMQSYPSVFNLKISNSCELKQP
ncbi:hypothetical protein [Mangrovibacterium sp.]|uniref:hypothetical protein n=1 Tax=Mangrovibacterium sp. TaxID=1961364 RepID=UPI00356AE95A